MPDTVRQVPVANDRHRCESGAECPVSPSHSFKRSRSTYYLVDRRTSPPPPGRLLRPPNASAADWCAAFLWTLVGPPAGLRWMAHALLVRAPAACLCLWTRAAWTLLLRAPLVACRRALRACFARRHRGRTVLISGGSTVQALHLARNYYATGARVVVCEVEGRAELCSFSIAVDAHYTVPGPAGDDSCVQYVDALRSIVRKERVGFYVPAGATVTAYHDAVAKSHLEPLGCRCHAPGLDAVAALDDLAEVFRRCEAAGMPVPRHLLVQSKEDIVKLYDNVSFRADRHFIVNVGASGCKARRGPFRLPADRRSLRLPGPVSADCPWLLVHIGPGAYYTTCTTVHRGRVIGNVTCPTTADDACDASRRGRGAAGDGQCAARDPPLDDWVARYVSALPAPLDGTVEFTLCVTPSRGVVPVGCRVGVPVTYASYRSNIERTLWPAACAEPAEPAVHEIVGRYYATALARDAVAQLFAAAAVCRTVRRVWRTVATRREMLFDRRDPLPYFAYYNMPLVTEYIRNALLGGGGDAGDRYTTF